MEDYKKNNSTKSAEEKVEDLKRDIMNLGFDLNETEEGIEILERNEK